MTARPQKIFVPPLEPPFGPRLYRPLGSLLTWGKQKPGDLDPGELARQRN